ncbi:MAG: hypothetical protein MUE67_11920 [Anaerolineales bacterium]|nr:hypothetical protein [Anaerolineales bacterium]
MTAWMSAEISGVGEGGVVGVTVGSGVAVGGGVFVGNGFNVAVGGGLVGMAS